MSKREMIRGIRAMGFFLSIKIGRKQHSFGVVAWRGEKRADHAIHDVVVASVGTDLRRVLTDVMLCCAESENWGIKE